MRGRRLAPLAAAAACAGCTSFATVRSAEVHPGPSLTLQGSVTTPPGDDAAWFWSFSCAFECNHPIGGFDLGVAFGTTGGTPYALGAGFNAPLHPYLEGYVQLDGGGASPYGLGARLGIPLTSWNSHQLYGRYDVRLESGRRVLVNPGLFLHSGTSPNGENPGHFLALVPAAGLLLEGRRVSWVPAVALGVGTGARDGAPFSSAFAAFSLGVTLHRARSPGTPP